MPRKLLDGPEFDDNDVVDGEFEDMTGIQGDLDEQLDHIISELSADDNSVEYTMKVFRPQAGKGKMGYLFTCSYTELPILDRLRDEYGGGDFEVRIFRGGKIHRRRTCIVEPPPKKLNPPPQAPMEMNAMANAMSQGFERLGTLLVSQQNQNTGMKDALENMVLMKQVMGTPEPPPDPLSQLKGLLEIQQMVGGNNTDGGAETNVNDVLLSMAETVLPKLAEAATTETPLKTVSESPTLPIPLQDIPPETEKGKANPMKMHLVFLSMQAKRKGDPMVYAQMVLDHTPDDKLDDLIDFMEHDNCLEDMTQIHSDVANYKEWFIKLSKCILSLVEENEETIQNEPLTPVAQAANTIEHVPTTEGLHGDIIPNTQRSTGNEIRDEDDAAIDTTGKKESGSASTGG